MLLLQRQTNEEIIIGGNVIVKVCRIIGDHTVVLGIDAPKELRVDRAEVHNERVKGALRALSMTDQPAARAGSPPRDASHEPPPDPERPRKPLA